MNFVTELSSIFYENWCLTMVRENFQIYGVQITGKKIASQKIESAYAPPVKCLLKFLSSSPSGGKLLIPKAKFFQKSISPTTEKGGRKLLLVVFFSFP